MGIMRNGSTGNLLMMVEGLEENVNVYFKLVMWYDVKGQSLGLYVDVLSCGDIYEEVGEWCEQWWLTWLGQVWAARACILDSRHLSCVQTQSASNGTGPGSKLGNNKHKSDAQFPAHRFGKHPHTVLWDWLDLHSAQAVHKQWEGTTMHSQDLRRWTLQV